jgi:2-oxoisovalerate dehydrogenase E2 component (dihydrolipoyl transacylase)
MNDFILPDIGEGIVECELLKWLVKEGDVIREDQPVAEVMTDKATVEIPAMHNGVVAKLYYQEGDIAKLHAPLFAMQDDTKAPEEPETLSEASIVAPAIVPATNSTAEKIESFVLPDIGEGIVECEIMIWHVAEGDIVEEDQVVVEVMTDKAVVEIPAKYQGKILKLHYQKGDIAKVHAPLFDQAIDGINISEPASDEHEVAKAPVVQALSNEIETNQQQLNTSKQGEQFEAPIDVERAIASPAVRRLAREHGISLDAVNASGKKGRVLKQDVINSLGKDTSLINPQPTQQQSTEAKQQPNTQPDSGQPSTVNLHTTAHDRVEAIKGIKAAMAKQMVASVSTIPHFTVSDELCMDQLISIRQTLKPEFEKVGLKLSFMPFFIKALSLAMHEYPIINSRLNEEATELTYVASHNIGIAVDSKIGLLVPNIKNVQDKSLLDIARDFNRLIEAAKEGKLSNADLKDGTVSISNIGAIGGITATPVINKPEVAIVALGKTQQLPRFDDKGQVSASNIMMVNWSGDHRVIDGATMVKFNNLWLEYLSQPQKMLVHLR